MRWIISIFALATFSATAVEGMQFLNQFPKNDSFLRLTSSLENTFITTDELSPEEYSTTDKTYVVSAVYGKRIDTSSWWAIMLPYVNKEENSLRYGEPTRDNAKIDGLREPQIAYNKRFQSRRKETGVYVSDYRIRLVPGLFDEYSSNAYHSSWSGSSALGLQASTGAVYERYEGRLGAEYTYHTSGQGKVLGKKFDSDPIHTLEFFLDVQYMSASKWHFFMGSGIFITSDYYVRLEESVTAIQQGTASIGHFGVKYVLSDSIWALKYVNRTNDTFTANDDRGNFRGEYTQERWILEFTKEL